MKNTLLGAAVLGLTAMTTAVASAALAGSTANDFVSLGEQSHTFTVQGWTVTIAGTPELAIRSDNEGIVVEARASVDLGDLQSFARGALEKRHVFEDCGNRVTTQGASVAAGGDGTIRIGLEVTAQQWLCVSNPVTVCEDTWIKIGGLKTKGIPKCRIEMRDGLKTKLISQSARIEGYAFPVIAPDGRSVSADVQITKALPSGLLGGLVSTFGLEEEIKRFVRAEVRSGLADKRFELPAELHPYDVKIVRLEFVDRGDGRLGAELHATGRITAAQLAELVSKML